MQEANDTERQSAFATMDNHPSMQGQPPNARASSMQTIHKLPSYRLRRDHSLTAKRDAPTSEPHATTKPVRPGSISSLRPLVNAVVSSNRLAAKSASIDKHEAQRYEAMVQHFQIRRLQTPNAPLDLPELPSTNDINDTDVPAEEEAPTTEESVIPDSEQTLIHRPSLEKRQRLVYHSKLPTADSSIGAANNLSSQTHRKSVAKLSNRAVAQKNRFSLSRQLKLWRRKITRTSRDTVNMLLEPMSPFSAVAQVRGILLLIACTWYITYIPLELAFSGYSASNWWVYVEILLELLFMTDLALVFNTAFVDEAGELVTSRKRIACHYLRGWFVPDLLSSVPIGIITILRDGHMNSRDTLWNGGIRVQRLVHVVLVIRMLWFARARRALKGFSAWFLYSRYSHLHRIVWVLLWIVFIAHWMACGWKLLKAPDTAQATLAQDYASSFYDALQLLQGQGLATENTKQNLFAAFAVLAGSIVLAVVFGHVAVLVSNFNANSTNYQRKMETVFAVMTKMQLPVLLRERIHQYYEHLWREYESLDGELIQFSKELTHTLELEVLLFKYMAVVMHIPFWNEATPDFLKQIVLNIQVRVYLPDDYVIRRNEIGDEYYIINRGFCELLTGPDSFERASTPLSTNKRQGSLQRMSVVYEDTGAAIAGASSNISDSGRASQYRAVRPMSSNGNLVSRLSCGQSFGEMALIMNYQRTADARALTYVEMCVLKREHFQRILVRYPEDRKLVMTKMLTNTMVGNDIHNVVCPLKNIVRSVFGTSIEDKSITAKQAASLIIEVINLERQDDSLTFGIDIQLQQRLITLHEQQQNISAANSSAHSVSSLGLETVNGLQGRKTSLPTPSKATAQSIEILASLESRVAHVEASQIEMVQAVRQIHATLVEIKQIQDKTSAVPSVASIVEPPWMKTVANTTTTAIDPPSANMPVSRKKRSLRRVFSSPNLNPQDVTDSIPEEATPPARRSSQMHVAYSVPQPRGVLRRMGSLVGIYAGLPALEPSTSTSQFADQLFNSHRKIEIDTREILASGESYN